MLDGDVASGAHVVDLARLAPLDQEPIGPHHVAHVGEIPPRAEVAHGQRRRSRLLSLHDAASQSGNDERLGLARPGVVERPHPDHREPVAQMSLQPQELGGDLARRVGGHREQGRILAQRELLGLHHAVLLGRSDQEDGRSDGTGPRRFQHLERPQHVHAHHLARRRPRATDVRERGQVIDGFGASVGQGLSNGGGVRDLEAVRRREHLVARGAQVPGQPRADEAVSAGDERPHEATLQAAPAPTQR